MLTLLIPTKNRFDELNLLLKRLEHEDPNIVTAYISDNASDDPRYRTELGLITAQHPLRIIVTRHPTPVTAFANWRSLLYKANNKYIAFCGDDDFWEPGSLSKTTLWMDHHDVDFSYPREWHLHSRKLPNQRTLSVHQLPQLPKEPLDRVLAFYAYDNDPMVYGIFEYNLMTKMFGHFLSGWKLLPISHITDTAYPGVVSALLHAKNPEWSSHGFHSQGIIESWPGNKRSRARNYIALKTNYFYIARRMQQYLLTIKMAKEVTPDTGKLLVFALRLGLIMAARIPVLAAAIKDIRFLSNRCCSSTDC
jgi:hypothetical protein